MGNLDMKLTLSINLTLFILCIFVALIAYKKGADKESVNIILMSSFIFLFMGMYLAALGLFLCTLAIIVEVWDYLFAKIFKRYNDD